MIKRQTRTSLHFRGGFPNWHVAPVSAAVAALAVAGSAMAQEAAVAAAPPQAASAPATGASAPTQEGLQEVVVTAERTSVNLQKVPIAASVLTADAIESQGIESVDDLQRVVPAVSISTMGRSTSINIRGVGLSQTSPGSSPGVAFYINGMLQPQPATIRGSMYDIDSIEVLRGPQGTLAGQNSTGGAIYLRTPAPKLNKFSGYIDETIGNYDWFRTIGAVNVPLLTDTVAARVSIMSDRRNSFYENDGGPAHPGLLNDRGARVDLLATPISDLRVNLRYEYSRTADDNDPYLPFTAPHGTRTISEDADSYNHLTTHRADGEIQYDITPTLQARWLTNHQATGAGDLSDSDRSAAPIGVNGVNSTYDVWTHEVNLISSSPDLQWIAGAFYMKNAAFTDLLGYMGSPTAVAPPAAEVANLAASTSKSLFGQVTYPFAQRWRAIAGFRESWDEQSYNRTVAPAPFLLGYNDVSSKAPTGKLALDYTDDGGNLDYVSLARGYKAGGMNLATSDPGFKPETNTSLEAGTKQTFLDRRFRVNLSVFGTRYDSIQMQTAHELFPGSGLFPLTQNSGKARSFGGELETAAALGALQLNASAAYLDSKTSAAVTLQDPVSGLVLEVPSGTTLAYAPKWTLHVGAEYSFTLPSGLELVPRVQASYLSRQYTTLFPSSTVQLDARTVLDASLTFYTPSDNWHIELFGSNLLNRTYVNQVNQNGLIGLNGYAYGPPRQYGVRTKFSF